MNAKHLATTTAIQIAGIIAAGSEALELVRHHVGIGPTVVAVLAIANAVLALAIRHNARAHTWRCPKTGCDVQIRAQGITAAEQQQYEAYATDHSRHGA